jgi:hypothetical protein
MKKFPFEATVEELEEDPEPYIDAIFACLESEFLIMPKGNGFIEYPIFENGYETLKRVTNEFSDWTPENIYCAILSQPISLIVLRTILGFTPPEWAYLATRRTDEEITQGFARSLDREIRMAPNKKIKPTPLRAKRLKALIVTACDLLVSGAPSVGDGKFHRLDKADTRAGAQSIQSFSRLGAPYAVLLYERFLGRPFAGHRDSVSDLVGDKLEHAIETVLDSAGISFRKTKRAEKIAGFDQTPDFIIPSEFNPQVVIEAKITEDDGTARDKATRIQHLGELSMPEGGSDIHRFEVVACIGGRGFGVRREDMKKILRWTRGKVFTVKTLDQMVAHTRLNEFRAKKVVL